MISETCSCGARFRTDEPKPLPLVREWRRKHNCHQFQTEPDMSHTVATSDTTISLGFQPGEMPAKEYDPWDDSTRA